MADRLSSVLDVLDQRLAAGKITQADHLVQCEKAIAAFSAAQGPAKAEKEGLGATIATLESADTKSRRDLVVKVAAEIGSSKTDIRLSSKVIDVTLHPEKYGEWVRTRIERMTVKSVAGGDRPGETFKEWVRATKPGELLEQLQGDHACLGMVRQEAYLFFLRIVSLMTVSSDPVWKDAADDKKDARVDDYVKFVMEPLTTEGQAELAKAMSKAFDEASKKRNRDDNEAHGGGGGNGGGHGGGGGGGNSGGGGGHGGGGHGGGGHGGGGGGGGGGTAAQTGAKAKAEEKKKAVVKVKRLPANFATWDSAAKREFCLAQGACTLCADAGRMVNGLAREHAKH